MCKSTMVDFLENKNGFTQKKQLLAWLPENWLRFTLYTASRYNGKTGFTYSKT